MITKQELLDQYKKEMEPLFYGQQINLENWLINKVIDLNKQIAVIKFCDDIIELSEDVCPKCGNTNIITTIYCNECNESF